MMSIGDFTIERGRGLFAAECDYRLLLPKAPAPDGGRALVVCLHGMGMTAEQFALILGGLFDPRAAYLVPQGVYPYEVHGRRARRIGYAWYLYDGNDEPFRSSSLQTEAYLLGLIERVAPAAQAASDRVFLLGFSQGAYLSYLIGMRQSHRLAGLIGIGGRVREERIAADLPSARRLPILMVHGEEDRSIPLAAVEETFRMFRRHGFPVELVLGPGGHEVRGNQLAAIRGWLAPRLGPPAP